MLELESLVMADLDDIKDELRAQTMRLVFGQDWASVFRLIQTVLLALIVLGLVMDIYVSAMVMSSMEFQIVIQNLLLFSKRTAQRKRHLLIWSAHFHQWRTVEIN